MVFRRETLRNTKTFKQTQPQGQANLDFSEKTVTNQHDPINSGQEGGFLPSAFAEPTNANGTQADLNFDPKTISNSTSNINLNSTNTGNGTNPFGNSTIPMNEIKPTPYDNSSFNSINNSTEQYGRGMGMENIPNIQDTKVDQPKPVSKSMPSPSTIGGNRLTQDEYQAMLIQQKQNKTKNFEPIKIGSSVPKAVEFNPVDFFKGTKSGNEVFTDIPTYGNKGEAKVAQVKGYADVDPFGDFNESNPFSNEKKNKKALKDQFDLYSSFTNF